MMAGMLAGTATGNIDAMAAEKIGEAEAKEIAAEDAGHSVDDVRFDRIEIGTEQGASVYDEKDATFTKFENGDEDGIAVYEIEFEDADAEYDYDVAKAGGKILNASRKVKVPACVAAEEKANAETGTGKTGREAAIDAALDHAGFNADEVSGLRCEKDYDDGREIYDVEFRHGGYEYTYDIDAHSYRIVEWDKDYDD